MSSIISSLTSFNFFICTVLCHYCHCHASVSFARLSAWFVSVQYLQQLYNSLASAKISTYSMATSKILPIHPRPTTPNRPNDLTETEMLSECVTPQQQTNVIQMSLSPKSARWSDLTIICGSQTFEAHKVMVCSQVCCKFVALDIILTSYSLSISSESATASSQKVRQTLSTYPQSHYMQSKPW